MIIKTTTKVDAKTGLAAAAITSKGKVVATVVRENSTWQRCELETIINYLAALPQTDCNVTIYASNYIRNGLKNYSKYIASGGFTFFGSEFRNKDLWAILDSLIEIKNLKPVILTRSNHKC